MSLKLFDRPRIARRPLAARLRALSAARMALTLVLGGCGAEAAIAETGPRPGAAPESGAVAAIAMSGGAPPAHPLVAGRPRYLE